MRRSLWVWVVVLAACERGGLRRVDGEVELSRRALQFEETFVGFPEHQPLVLHNRSRVDRRLTLTAPSPFSTVSEATIPAGGSLELKVTFGPAAPGPAFGSLLLTEGEQTVAVALAGTGVSPPSCAASALCRRAAFDPNTGRCEETFAADGTACSSILACTVDGVCSGGVCLGNAPSCADQDPCTVDACQPGGGCLHAPRVCAAPADPCRAASCDPVLGCVEADAPDGTACGAADCATARVCILGACKTLAVPEGSACGEVSPCQGQGVCRQSRCELPPPTPLNVAWSHRLAGEFRFRGVSDAAQNLYWLECPNDTFGSCSTASCVRCEVRSFTRDGVERFRTDLGPQSNPGASSMHHLLAAGRLVFEANGRVGAVAATTGAAQWNVAVADTFGPTPDEANTALVQAMAGDGAGGVYLLVRRYQNTPYAAFPRHNAVVKLDAVSGATAFVRFFDGELVGAVVDEDDHLYFGFYPRAPVGPSAPAQLRSLSADGTERWQVGAAGLSTVPLAVYAGQLMLTGGRVVSTVDGTTILAEAAGGQQRNALMSAAGRTVLHGGPMTKPTPLPLTQVQATALPRQSETPAWSERVAEGSSWFGLVSDLVAASNGDVLVAGGQPDGVTLLTALTPGGATRFGCEVAKNAPALEVRFDSPVALLDGRWAAVERTDCPVCDGFAMPWLKVFDVPGERRAQHGWVGSFGNPAGGSRPLP